MVLDYVKVKDRFTVYADGDRIAQQFREYKINILWDLLLHLLVHK